MAVTVCLKPKGRLVTLGEGEEFVLAEFEGKGASLKAGIYRRRLVDGILELLARGR